MNKTVMEWLLACTDDENVVSIEDMAPSFVAHEPICDTVFNLLYLPKCDTWYLNCIVISWDVRNDGALCLNYDSTM